MTMEIKADVLEHLNKKMKSGAVAEKFGIADRTVRQIRKDEEKIKRQLDERPQDFFTVVVPFPLSLCIESTSYVLSFRMVFFLPCDHVLDF